MSKPGPAAAPSAIEGDAFLRAITTFGAGQAVRTSQPIYNTQGVMLLDAGVLIDDQLYERLSSHRLAAPIDESIEPESGVTGAVLRESAEAALNRWPFFGQMAQPGRMRSMLLEAIASVPLPKPVSLHLSVAKANQPALYEHSILMALLCAHLVREGGAIQHDISMAAAAGLLHDLGMLHIDAAVLDSRDPLLDDELEPLYMHPLTSAVVLKRFSEYPKQVLRAVVEHHELLDGSGYPRALSGDDISPLGRLLSLAEVVTAMFDGDRKYPEQRVSLLLRINLRRYDATLVPSIHKLLRSSQRPSDASTPTASESVATLRELDALLTEGRSTVAAVLPQIGAPRRVLLQPVSDQTDTLQRMLYEAGITPDQLGLMTDDEGGEDEALRIELWSLAEELQWQLRATAKQLQRRWDGVEPKAPLPPALAAWLDRVKAIDTPVKA